MAHPLAIIAIGAAALPSHQRPTRRLQRARRRDKLAARCNFEHVACGLIDDMGGLKDDGAFKAAWMTFCQENRLAEKRIATNDRLDSHERGRAYAMKALGVASPTAIVGSPPATHRFDPTRPDHGIVLTGQGNGRNTAGSDVEMILARQAVFDGTSAAVSHRPGTMPVAEQAIASKSIGQNQASPETGLAAAGPRAHQDKLLSDFFEEFLAGRRLRDGNARARSEIGPIVTFSRRVIGWSLQSRQVTDVVLQALLMAVWRRKPKTTVLVHSDQGSQFPGMDWAAFLKHHNLEHSMSRGGNCHDNTVAESLFNLLKRERIPRKT